MTTIPEDDFDESALFSAPASNPVATAAPATGNPLAAFFRLPGLSVSLPTNGAFFPKGGIELDEAGEVSVLPMKAMDELLLSSPDALMNNSAITKLIQSCVPAIKMPDLVSSVDLDVLLLAIRVASSGPIMEIELECPKCKENTLFEVDLPAVLASAKPVPPVNAVRLSNDVVVYIRPHNVAVQTKILVTAFKEQRKAQAIDLDESLDEDARSKALGDIMTSFNSMNLYGIASSVIKIVVPGAEVTDQGYITEFLTNTDKSTLAKVRKALEALNKLGVDKTIPAKCQHCAHEWESAIEFNPSTFFEERSLD